MLDDVDLRRNLVDGARRLAGEHDIKKTAVMLKELYESLVAGGISR